MAGSVCGVPVPPSPLGTIGWLAWPLHPSAQDSPDPRIYRIGEEETRCGAVHAAWRRQPAPSGFINRQGIDLVVSYRAGCGQDTLSSDGGGTRLPLAPSLTQSRRTALHVGENAPEFRERVRASDPVPHTPTCTRSRVRRARSAVRPTATRETRLVVAGRPVQRGLLPQDSSRRSRPSSESRIGRPRNSREGRYAFWTPRARGPRPRPVRPG